MTEKDVLATVPGCSIWEKDLARMLRLPAQKNADGTRRVDAATVPGQIARPDYERIILTHRNYEPRNGKNRPCEGRLFREIR